MNILSIIANLNIPSSNIDLTVIDIRKKLSVYIQMRNSISLKNLVLLWKFILNRLTMMYSKRIMKDSKIPALNANGNLISGTGSGYMIRYRIAVRVQISDKERRKFFIITV